MPKFNYLFHSLVVPKSFLNQKNSLLYYQFLWNNKPGKVKRTTFISDQENGGLNMIDLESHIYTTKKWVICLTDASQANWKCIAHYFLNVFEPNFLIFSMNPDSTKSLEVKHCQSTIKNLIEVWLNAKEINPKKLTIYQI